MAEDEAKRADAKTEGEECPTVHPKEMGLVKIRKDEAGLAMDLARDAMISMVLRRSDQGREEGAEERGDRGEARENRAG